MTDFERNELKAKMDIACSRLACAIRLNKATTTQKEIAKKWVQMSLTCSNR